jgi:ABC-2 type transport system ATP-binding protein
MPDEHRAGRLNDVAKRFTRGGPWIMRGVDLELPHRSRTVIVGDNGSGKSTLLRIAAGLTSPTSGSVTLATRTSFVPERLAGRSNLTPREYLWHMGRIRGLQRTAIEARSRDLLQRLGLLPHPDVPIDALSKGNKQKVIIAQAFLTPVDLAVLDEPYSGLDARARRALDDLIELERARGAAVLMTSHTVPPEFGPEHVYRIDDGRLSRMRAGPGTPPALRQIELRATDRSCPAHQILSAENVRSAKHDQAQTVLSLILEASDADAFLRDSITNGWSVTGVAPRQGDDP